LEAKKMLNAQSKRGRIKCMDGWSAVGWLLCTEKDLFANEKNW
jgi:hypothetical protein